MGNPENRPLGLNMFERVVLGLVEDHAQVRRDHDGGGDTWQELLLGVWGCSFR